MPGKFKVYMENIQMKTGNKPEDFWNLANEKGFIKEGKIVCQTRRNVDLAQDRNGVRSCSSKLYHPVSAFTNQ